MDLEMIDYNRRKQVIVKQSQKRKKIDLDTTILCTIEENMIDTKRARLSGLLSIGLAITYPIMDRARYEVEEIQNQGKQISLLENQVKYYKALHELVTDYVEEVLEEDKINTRIKTDFISKVFNLHELSLQLSILYKENLIWKEHQGKVQDQLNFIKQIQKYKGHEEHKISLLAKTELYELEQYINY